MSSYFLYLYCIILTLFSSITVQFSILFYVSNLIQAFKTDSLKYSTQYSLVIYNSCSIDYPVSCRPSCTSDLYQLSSLTMIYFIMGFKSLSPTFLVAMYDNCRPPSHQSILYIFLISHHFSQNLLL